jgi:hypothetical protein
MTSSGVQQGPLTHIRSAHNCSPFAAWGVCPRPNGATYCAEFGGVVGKDQPGGFRAKLADRPATCAVPPPCP